MTVYRPDSFMVVKLKWNDESKAEEYRVVGGWSGGYLDGDMWRINSGITEVEEKDGNLVFRGASGSEYIVIEESEGMSISMAGAIALLDRSPLEYEAVDLDEVKEVFST